MRRLGHMVCDSRKQSTLLWFERSTRLVERSWAQWLNPTTLFLQQSLHFLCSVSNFENFVLIYLIFFAFFVFRVSHSTSPWLMSGSISELTK